MSQRRRFNIISVTNGDLDSPATAWRRAALPLLLLVLVTLACGSFAPRPTPTPLPPTFTPAPEGQSVAPLATSAPVLPTSVPTRSVPTPTFTPTPVPGTVLIVGQPARVVSPQGLNVRDDANVRGERLGRLAPGLRVDVVDGPVEADGYRWWRVKSTDLEGWVADGDDTDEWLSPRLGDVQPVNRPVQPGDEVVVTAQAVLTVRAQPGLDALVERRLPPNTRLSIVGFSVDADGYRWWQVSDETGTLGWAAEGDASERWLTPLE